VAPRCRSVAYWLTDGSSPSGAPRQLANDAVVCLKGLYNVEARPACAPPAAVDLPVTIRLLDANRSAIRTKTGVSAPFLLWDKADPGASRGLADGAYYLASSIDGFDPIRITQSCPRPRRPRRRSQCPPKGMMMAMMMAARCPSGGKGM
jgi:hypothetical protein